MGLRSNIKYKTKEQALTHVLESVHSNFPDELKNLALVAMGRWGDQEYANAIEDVDMFETVRKVSTVIKDDRDQYRVLASTTEELGELAQEIRVANGHSYKEEGSDGVIGEAIDVIACALDLIAITNGNITGAELNERIRVKCAKWLKNTPEQFIVD